MLNNISEIGNRIKNKREELEIKQQTFAEEIKIDKSSLNRYEKGKQTPSLETLVAIANGLGTSLDFLVFGLGVESVSPIKQEEKTYAYCVLRAITTLVENGIFSVVDNKSIEGIALNIRKNYKVLQFFDEITNFAKCRERIDEKSYSKGIDQIIRSYEYEVITEDQAMNPPFGYPDYSRIKQNEDLSNSIIEEIKKHNITK